VTALPPDADTEVAPETEPEPEPEPEPAESTGVAAADEAAARLNDVERAPLDDHVEIYEDAHRRLQEGLADLDDR
jgi:hypothetical protein